MAQIPLRARDGSVRAWATVDDADLPLVGGHRWCLMAKDGYAGRTDRSGEKQRTVLLHRVIMGLTPGDGREVDHRNGDGLDCRRANLRIVTHAENGQNRVRVHGLSRYRGVTWHVKRQAWSVRVGIDYRRVFGGYFTDEDEAGQRAAELRAELLTHSSECEAA